MKVRLKKSVDIPPEIKAFTDRVLATPLDSISEALNGFTWKYEKGDFYQWVPLFNHFDAFFDQFVLGRSDLKLQFAEGESCAPFPVANTLAVLKVTARILENCTNKHLYQSYEHLTDLLAAAEKEVVFASLQALVAFLRKTHHSSVRFHGYPKLNSRLFDLCRGWGGKEEGLDLVACVNEDQEPLKKFISRGTMLHFEFYADNRGEADQESESRRENAVSSAGQQIVHIPNLDKTQDSDHDILRQLVQKYRVPADIRFRLLTRIRIAHGFGTLEGRRHLVRVRLLAFCVLFQSNSLHEEMLSFFVSEPEFMNELVGLVQNEEGIPLELRTFALRALAVQLVDRSRHAAVINAIGVGGQNGVLSILLQDSINYITSPDTAADIKPKYNASFVEALLSLVGALVSSSSGSVALSEAGFIPALLPLIQDSNPTHVSLVCTAVKILEAFMDFSSPASAMFRGLGGLTFMIKRLESEVGVVMENEPDVEVDGGVEAGVTAVTAPDEGTSSAQGNPGEELASSAPKQIPYVRRLLLKSLLRAIALASYAPTSGTGRRPDESDAQTLYACLRTMFLRSRDFGGALFALAASVVTDLIHHDPLCFRSLHAVGVPEAFLTAVREGVTPSSEAVCCVPNNLVALCLNSIGLELVKETHTLDCLVNIFTSKQYLRALSGDTASILGAGIDELLRHVPALKDEGIEVVIAIFQAICILGGDAELIAQHSQDKMETSCESGDVEMASTGEQESEATNLGTSRQQQETSVSPDSVSFTPRQRKVAIPQEVWDRSKEKGIDTTLPECISHATKMLEALLSNQEATRRVVESGGIDLLLRLYRLPRMPPAFGSSSQSHTMLQIFRAITPNHQHSLPKKVKDALVSQLEGAILAAEKVMGCCVPTMEPAARDDYVRLIASTGGLTGIAAMVARSAIPMLVEICKGDQSLLSSLGQLERMVLSQLVHADLWKERKEKEKKDKEKDKGGDAGARSSTPPSVPSPADVAMAGTEEADVVEVGLDGDQDADGDGDQMDLESVEMLRGANAPRIGGGRLTDTGNAYGSRSHRKKSLEDVAYDVLQHFVVSVRGFYMAVAKSIHTPARRQQESFTQPTIPMRVATLGLALVLEHNLDYDAMKSQEKVGGEGGSGSEIVALPNFSRRARHLSRLVEEVMMVLFDNRRQYCHTLILNYFVAVGGMASLTRRFQEAVEMLWEVVEAERAKRVAANPMSEINDGSGANAGQDEGSSAQAAQGFSGANPSFLESVNHLVNLISGEGSPLRVVEGVVLSMLGLFEQLTTPRLFCQYNQAATLLTVPLPVPGADESASVPTNDAETFIKDLQACVLGAIMPVWTSPLLPHSSPQITSSVITILNSCSDGTGTVATALRGAGPIRHPGIGRGPPPPDRDIIQQIQEMGFSTARAEEALRRVGQNSVELATDWLINHPEEPAPPPVVPAPPPEAGAEDAPVPPAQGAEEGDANTGAAEPEPPAAQTADEVAPNQPVDENPEASGSIILNENQSNSEDKMLAQALAVSLSEIRAADGGGAGAAGPSTSDRPVPHELDKAEIPKPIDLVTRAVAVLEKMPVAAFSLTDLVMTLCNRDGGKDRALVLAHLIGGLRGEGTVEEAVRLPAAKLNARSHLLVVLLSESPQCRETAAEKGVVRIALEMLEAWEAHYKSAADAGQISLAAESGSKSTTAETKLEIPMWVEALLLMLDTMAQTQPKQTQRAQAASGLINRANPPVTPTAEAAAGGAAGAAETTPASTSGPASVPGLSKLLSTWQPCGLLSVEEHQAALQICIRLLSHLHTYGNSIKLPGQFVGDMLAQPDPAATTQAVLQVMARLTRCHKRALEVLHGGGVDLMLTLPAACLLPKHEAHISTILKHILEDPGTLQTYMEAEIKNLLTSRNRHNLGPHSIGHFGSGHTNTMPVRTFLQNLASVINRDPKVFMEAVSSTCSIEASSGAHSHQSIALKKTKPSASDPNNKDSAPQSSTPHRASKSGKRVVPVSFVEVIDKLLDLVSKFNPAVVEKACQEEKIADQKKESGSRGATGLQGLDVTEEGGSRATTRDATDPILELSQWLMEGRVGNHGSGDRFTNSPIIQAGSSGSMQAKDVVMNHRDTIMQVMILRMLSEFCLMYTSTVGVLLKRDTEIGHKDGEGSSAAHGDAGLLKRLLHTHLACQSDSSPLRPGVSEEASRFLQAVCIRSGEGRKRIVSEIVATINEAVDSDAAVTTSFDMPFVTKEGVPSGFKIKVFIDLIGSLLSASSGNHSENRSSNQTSGLTVEMIRSMRDAGVVAAMTRALRLVEMEHPEAPKAINSIIKPLEVLTRSIPAQSKRGGGSGNTVSQGGTSAVAVPRREQGQTYEQALTDAVNTALRGHGDEVGNYVSEAGPQAMAVAGQMIDDVMEDVSLLMTPVENLRDIIEDDEDDDDSPLAGDEDEDDEMDEVDERLGALERLGTLGEQLGALDMRLRTIEPELRSVRARVGALDDEEEHDEHDEEDEEVEDEEDDHVVVDDGDEEASEGMGHEDEGDSERSRTPDGVLDEDEEEDIEDEDEDDEGEEGSADMELDDGEDWDDEDSREYAEALDRIEGEIRGEASNLARGYVRLQPHLRSMFGSLLGNFMGSGGDIRIDRRGFRYRPPRFDRSTTNSIPYQASVGPSQHRLLTRPPVPPPNSTSSRSLGTLTEALMGAGAGTSDGGLGWRRIAFSSGMGGDLMNSLPDGGDSGFVSFRMDNQLRPLTRMGGAGGWQLMTGLNPSSMMDMDYRPGRDPARSAAAGASSWLSGLQGALEQHIVEMLRENPPPTPQAEQPQPEQDDEMPPTAAAPQDSADQADGDDAQDPMPAPPRQEESPHATPQQAPQPSASPTQSVPIRLYSSTSSDYIPDIRDEQRGGEAGGSGNDATQEDLALPQPIGNQQDNIPDRAHESEPSPSAAATQALTPEFVQNAIQNTLRALANQGQHQDQGNERTSEVDAAPENAPPPQEAPPMEQETVADEDEEMADVIPGLEAGDDENEGDDDEVLGSSGSEGRSEEQGEDDQPEPGPATDDVGGDEAGPPLDPEIMERAAASGIDRTFLQALPRNLQLEVLSQRGVSVERLVNPAPDAAPAQAAGGNEGTPPAQNAGGAGPDEVDPDFLAALPPDIREEVLETQRLGEQRREVERRLAQGGPDDVANIVASLPEDIREEVLLYSGPDVLANLPPELIAEGQRLRDRHMRHVAQDHEDGMARNFFFRRLRQDRDQGNPRSANRSPTTYGTRKDKRDEMEGPPPLEEAALVTLVELLRLSQPIHKGQLQKLFLNLCSRADTRSTIIQLLLSRLTESSRATVELDGGAATSSSVHDLDDKAPMRVDSQDHSAGPVPKSWPGTPPTVTRRILDLLSYLARHQNSKVAEILLELRVPVSKVDVTNKAAFMGKLPASVAGMDPKRGALEVLLEMLGQPLCQRSVSTLEQNLHLLEVVMQCATAKAAASARQAAAAEASRKQSNDMDTGEAPSAQESIDAPDAADSNQAAGTSRDIDSSGSGVAASGGAGAVGGSGSGSGGSAGPTTRSRPPAIGEDEGPSTSATDQSVSTLWELSDGLLRWLPGLLGKRGLSDRAYRTCASVVKLLVEAAPRHRMFMMLELQKEAGNLTEILVETLERIGANGMDGSSTTANAVGSTGALILRILHAVESLIKVEHQGESDTAPEIRVVVQQVALKLDALWTALSSVIAEIEKKIRHSAESQTEANAAAKILPPGAAQILPLVESFYVLCSAQGCLPAPPLQAPADSSDLGNAVSDAEKRASRTQALASSSDSRALVDKSQPLMRFSEAHRVMLNAFLRQTPALLEGSLSPLLRAPRLIDFDNKRLYFRSKVRSEERHYGPLRINVRREHVFEDSFHQLRHKTPEELRCKLSVQFAGEEGIDAGGVSREWYQVMSREIFNPNLALFVAVPEGTATFQPNPNSVIQNDRGVNHLDFFKFVGRIIGKALYDGQLVDVHFTRSFYKHMLNLALTYEDLEAVDPDYYKQMKWTLEHDITDVLDQVFAAEVDFFGRKEVVELKPEGTKTKVTEENKMEYVNLMTKHKMTTAIRSQIKAFQEGFWELVPKELVVIFNDNELELLISGLPEVDIADLKANTEYSGYTAASPVIQWFWEVVEELGKEELALLLQFVTGTSKVPLEGFQSLQGISGPQKFQIHKSYADANRLPSAHTCFNQLDLPEYPTKEKLKDRLLVAVHEGNEGFGFG